MGYSLADGSGRGIGLVVGAPVVLVDGNLAVGGSTPRSATGAIGGAFGAGEIETSIPLLSVVLPFTAGFSYSRLAQNNDTSLVITEVRDQLIGGLRVDGGGITATSGGRSETLRGARDTDSGDLGGNSGNSRENISVLHLGS